MRDSAIKNINGINNDKFPPYRNNSFILFKIIESLLDEINREIKKLSKVA